MTPLSPIDHAALMALLIAATLRLATGAFESFERARAVRRRLVLHDEAMGAQSAGVWRHF